jgi:hypothetical protein
MKRGKEKESQGTIIRRLVRSRSYLVPVLLIPLVAVSIVLAFLTTAWLMVIGLGMALGSPVALFIDDRTRRRNLSVAFSAVCGIAAAMLFANIGLPWLIAGLGIITFPAFMLTFALAWAEFALIYYRVT